MLASGNLDEGDYVPDVEEIKDEPAREHNPNEHELIDDTHDFFLLALATSSLRHHRWTYASGSKNQSRSVGHGHLWQPFEEWQGSDVWQAALGLERQFDAVKDKILQNAKTTKELANAEVGV